MRNIVLHAAHDAAMGPRAEQRIIPGSNARPADVEEHGYVFKAVVVDAFGN